MTDRSISASLPLPHDDHKRRPKFQIQQLLVLTVVMAVMLAAGGRLEIQDWKLSPLAQYAIWTWTVLFTLMGSIAVTIVGYGIWWRAHGRSFFTEPGHWLLTVIAAQQMLALMHVLLLAAIAGVQGIDRVEATKLIPLRLNMYLPSIVLAIVNVYIGRRKCSEARWRRVFYAHGFASIVPVIGQMLVMILLERAVRAERVRRPLSPRWKNTRGVEPMTSDQVVTSPRDIAHWCGVAFTFIDAGVVVLFALGIVFYVIGPALFP